MPKVTDVRTRSPRKVKFSESVSKSDYFKLNRAELGAKSPARRNITDEIWTRPTFVRLSAISMKCWFASVEIGGGIVDTGSSVSLLSKEIYETLSFRLILTEVADTLPTADGEPLCVYGKSIFPDI